MPKPKQAPVPDSDSESRFRDDANNDAVSMHTTRSDYEYDDVPDLPSYSDSEAAAHSQQSNQPTITDEYASIKQQTSNGWRVEAFGKPVSMNETSIRMDPRLNHPDELCDYIENVLRVIKPNPAVRVCGHHSHTTYNGNKKETEKVIDFDFSFSFQKYLRAASPGRDEQTWWCPRVVDNGDRVLRGGWRKVRAKGHTQNVEITETPVADLMDWCREYCGSKSALKIFRVEREVTGLDTKLLSKEIETLIRSTGYRGHITVMSTTEDKNVDIYSDHIINRWRITWVRYIFFVTFLWIFTWPLLFFLTARWSIYRVNWAFSRQVQTASGWTTEWASIDERTWLRTHSNLIKTLALENHQGDATDFSTDVQPDMRRGERGQVRTGHAGVDGAIGAIQGGLQAWNAIQGRNTSSRSDGWGGDSY